MNFIRTLLFMWEKKYSFCKIIFFQLSLLKIFNQSINIWSGMLEWFTWFHADSELPPQKLDIHLGKKILEITWKGKIAPLKHCTLLENFKLKLAVVIPHHLHWNSVAYLLNSLQIEKQLFLPKKIPEIWIGNEYNLKTV